MANGNQDSQHVLTAHLQDDSDLALLCRLIELLDGWDREARSTVDRGKREEPLNRISEDIPHDGRNRSRAQSS